MAATTQLLTGLNNHVFICGITRSGKTYFAKKAAAQIPGPVLFFNIQEEELQAPFIECNSSTDVQQLDYMLTHNYKINFTFKDQSIKEYNAIVAYLLGVLMRSKAFSERRPVYVVIDEAQLLDGRGLDAAIDVSTRGLARGVRLISITQRPALVNKTIYTQAIEQYIFKLAPSEQQYFKGKGVNYDECARSWAANGEHSYVFFDGFTLIPRKAIK